MPLGAYENICDIARQRGMVLHPGDLSNRPLLPPSNRREQARELLLQQTPEPVSPELPTWDCISLRADSPGWCGTGHVPAA